MVFPVPELFFFKHSRSFSIPKVPTREPKRLFFLSSAYIETKIWEVFFVNQDVSLKMTELDRLTSLPHMQLVKAALPYIHIPEQRFFSLFVKFRELEKTMQLFADPADGEIGICSVGERDKDSPVDMLKAIKPYGTEEEQSSIDLVLNLSKVPASMNPTGKICRRQHPFRLRKISRMIHPILMQFRHLSFTRKPNIPADRKKPQTVHLAHPLQTDRRHTLWNFKTGNRIRDSAPWIQTK